MHHTVAGQHMQASSLSVPCHRSRRKSVINALPKARQSPNHSACVLSVRDKLPAAPAASHYVNINFCLQLEWAD